MCDVFISFNNTSLLSQEVFAPITALLTGSIDTTVFFPRSKRQISVNISEKKKHLSHETPQEKGRPRHI